MGGAGTVIRSGAPGRDTVESLSPADPRRHPRPALTRPVWQPLDGAWAFARGGSPAAGPPELNRQVIVPFAPESPASGVGEMTEDAVAWYRRTLDLPDEWRGQRAILHFNAVDWEATVWVGGQLVARHEGGYTPFSVDVTELVQDGPVDLLVRCVDDPHDMSKPRGKQDWLPEPHSIWYPRTTGIWQSVWWEPVGDVRVEALAFTADLPEFALDMDLSVSGVLEARYRTSGQGSTSEGLSARVRLTLQDEVLVDDRIALNGRRVRRRFHLQDPGIDDARERYFWTPETPNLISATVTLERSGKTLDEVHARTAMRTIEAREGRVLLNGRPYRPLMALDQGYWEDTHLTPPDVLALARDIELAKALGFNGVRKHQKLEDPRFYAWADHLGLLVWVELPSAYAFDATAARRLTQTWMEAIQVAAPHPSVVAWVPFNESWGVPDLPNSAAQRALVTGLAELTRALDPSRPVVGNDGWEMLCTDMVNVHDYERDPDVLASRYATAEATAVAIREHRPGGRRLLLAGEERADKPVLLTEFGGVRVQDGTPGWGYDAVSDGAELLERYTALMEAVHDSSLAGSCYTQLTDTFQERNGLLNMDRTPKADTTELARATRGQRRRREDTPRQRSRPHEKADEEEEDV